MTLGNITFGPAVFKDFDKFFVGFDDTYNRLSKIHDDLTQSIPNYPPYNIKKVNDNTYVIELAVAGFARQDIEIVLEDNKLVIKGTSSDDTENFIFKGIANRAFTRTFALDDQIVIKDAAMFNGMLKIALEKIIPEHRKPRKIEISDEPSTVTEFAKGNPQFLVEDADDNSK
jgi:molecular chaperone IbpA